MYKNVTEIIIEQKLEALLKNSDCCKCSRCRDDIMCYALNRMKPKYVSTTVGELFNKASSLAIEQEVEVTKVITMAIQVVEENPRHANMKTVNGSYHIFEEQETES